MALPLRGNNESPQYNGRRNGEKQGSLGQSLSWLFSFHPPAHEIEEELKMSCSPFYS